MPHYVSFQSSTSSKFHKTRWRPCPDSCEQSKMFYILNTLAGFSRNPSITSILVCMSALRLSIRRLFLIIYKRWIHTGAKSERTAFLCDIQQSRSLCTCFRSCGEVSRVWINNMRSVFGSGGFVSHSRWSKSTTEKDEFVPWWLCHTGRVSRLLAAPFITH